MSDSIDNLPYDQTPLSDNEMRIANTLFKEEQNMMDKLLLGSKDVILVAIILVLFSLPQLDEIIEKFIPPVSKSPYIKVGVKTLLFSLLYFIMKNMYLARV
jgi:hypothetical protein